MQRYQFDIFKIYFVVGLSCLLLTVSFYLFGFKPLSERLRTEHTHEIEHSLDTSLWLLQEVIDNHYDLARQSASRTAIRKKQSAYLSGRVSREQLVNFSAPKLADAMRANKEIVGISRFDPEGFLLFNVGLTLGESAISSCNLRNLNEIKMIGPVKLGDQNNRLLYCSPIFDHEAGHVGADILIMDDSGIERVIDMSRQEFGHIGVVQNKQIIYWPDVFESARSRSVLNQVLHGQLQNQEFIINSRQLEGVSWELYTVVNKDQFFASVNRQLLVLFAVVFLVVVIIFVFTLLVLRPIISLMLREKRLYELAHRDGLTGLYNHAYMQEFLDRELERSRRHGHPLSLLMFDIDHFKKVNDNYGHPVGDSVLRRIGDILSNRTRKIDLAARYGGEEFIVVLPDTSKYGGQILAERLRIAIANETVTTQNGEQLSVTVSIGVVSCNDFSPDYDKSKIIEAVDKALYQSKHQGRDRVTVASLALASS